MILNQFFEFRGNSDKHEQNNCMCPCNCVKNLINYHAIYIIGTVKHFKKMNILAKLRNFLND